MKFLHVFMRHSNPVITQLPKKKRKKKIRLHQEKSTRGYNVSLNIISAIAVTRILVYVSQEISLVNHNLHVQVNTLHKWQRRTDCCMQETRCSTCSSMSLGRSSCSSIVKMALLISSFESFSLKYTTN